ncbi:MAG: zinc ribbon domain-containing protein [Candidatus Acidiferrales bacterium]
MAFCTKCGAQVQDGSTFCTSCGQPVGAAAPAAPPQYQAAPAPPPPQYQTPPPPPQQYQAPVAPPPPQYQGAAAHTSAQQSGQQAVDMAKQGFGAIVGRMGLVTLIATIFAWICWFFMTGFTVSLSFFGAAQGTSVTLWQSLALDPTSNMAVGDHGFFSLVAVVFLLLPFAAAFIPVSFAKFLYAAPLVAVLIAWGTVEYQFSHMLSLMKAQMGDIPSGMIALSTGYGTYLALLASLAVAARIVTAPKS